MNNKTCYLELFGFIGGNFFTLFMLIREIRKYFIDQINDISEC